MCRYYLLLLISTTVTAGRFGSGLAVNVSWLIEFRGCRVQSLAAFCDPEVCCVQRKERLVYAYLADIRTT